MLPDWLPGLAILGLIALGAHQAQAHLNPKGVYFRPLRISPRERELLRLCEHGMTEREIASHMGLNPRTVYGYKQNVYAKLGVHSAPAAVLAARRAGSL